jgi:lipid-binding SYLF domain-containing protein
MFFPLSGYADKYQDTVAVFREASNSSSLFETAYGYAVFPLIGKGGFGIGAAHGRGKVYVDGVFTGDVSMTQLTIGFQFGGQAYKQVIFFKDETAYDEFTQGTFEFGAQANAIAITVSASAEASTKGHSIGLSTGEKSQTAGLYFGGMAVFTIAKGGLMYEASIGGQKFKFKPDLKLEDDELSTVSTREVDR